MSFDGKYVVKDAYESRMQGETEGAVTRVCDSDNREDATLFVRMPAFPSTSSGTAYVEVIVFSLSSELCLRNIIVRLN